MPPLQEIVQRLQTPLLDLVEAGRDPAFVGRFEVSNRMVRSLAHLAATTGRFSRLLRCDDDGKLHVVDSSLADVDVKASNAAAAGDSGLVVSSYYLKQLFDTLVTAKGPLRVCGVDGVTQLGLTGGNELKVQVQGGGLAAAVGVASAAAADDNALSVRNYPLEQLLYFFNNVYSEVGGAHLTVKELT